MKKVTEYSMFFIFLLWLSFFIVIGWQVDCIKISDNSGKIYYETVLPIFAIFDTSYKHSVEQTEVQDSYVIACGKMWSWEERTKSLKAGMPQQTPRSGRFFMTREWLVYQGGRISWNRFFYRIGDTHLGKNKATFPYLAEKKLYEVVPNRRLIIAVEKSDIKKGSHHSW